MDTVTRRKFLIASGVVGASALAAGAGAYSVADILGTAGRPRRGRATASWCCSRCTAATTGSRPWCRTPTPPTTTPGPQMAYDAGEVLRLDDRTGLNPALAGLKSLYDGRAAGDHPRRRVSQTGPQPLPVDGHLADGNPERPGTTGWLGRWLDTAGGDPRTAISLEPVLPPVLAGATSAGAAVALGGAELPGAVTAG